MEGTIYVDCPCCGERLEVQREDGRVVQRWPKAQKPAKNVDPIQAALQKLKADQAKRDRFFDTVKQDMEAKKKDMEARFEAERRRINEEGDTSRPPHPFDNE